MKKCINCDKVKSLDLFYNHATAKDGKRYTCKLCDRERDKCWRKTNHEHLQEYNKSRKQDNGRKQEWRLRNRIKVNAHSRVRYALQTGKIIRPDFCIINNHKCSGKVEAHHSDYSEPLSVEWVCRSHHSAWHRVFSAENGDIT